MKSVQETVCSYPKLLQAFRKSKQNILWKDSVIAYNRNKLLNCLKLKNELENGTYEIDKYITFTIYEPKKRDIVSTRLKDRVFQRSMCDNYLYNEITKHFIYDNAACQINKGTDFARNRLSVHLQKFYRKHQKNGYVLKCDIKDYFGSTDHEMAKSMLRKKISDDWAYERVAEIIDSFDGDKGIGLGSQVSQLIQLAVLDDLDHIIKERYHIEHYVRYMDDFILIHEDKEYLKAIRTFIAEYLNGIKLRLNDKKTQIFKLSQPIKYLGFSFEITSSGKVVKRLLQDNLKRQKKKLNGLFRRLEAGKLTMKDVETCYASWKAHSSKGNTHNLILKMDQYFNERRNKYYGITSNKKKS